MRTLITLIQLLVADRQRLMVENLALRHQLAVLNRSVKRPRIRTYPAYGIAYDAAVQFPLTEQKNTNGF